MNINRKMRGNWESQFLGRLIKSLECQRRRKGSGALKEEVSSVQFSHLVLSYSLRPHGLQHARPPCSSPTLGVYSDSSHWVGDAIQPSHPLSSPSPPAFNLSHIRVFSNESALRIRWLKYWSFSFNISPSNGYSRLISFRMDWLDLLAFQGTLKHLLQHHSSKASILRHSAFFIVQLSHPYMTTGKTIALITWTFGDKVMSLLLNMLSRLVITSFPRSKCLLISWLAVTICGDFGAPQNKVCHCFHCYSIHLPWSDGTGCHHLFFWMLSSKPTFSLSSFMLIQRPFSSSSLSATGWCHLRIWRRHWSPTPVLLSGKSHGLRSLVGCSPWGR